MIILSLIYLLLSNAVIFKQAKSILFSVAIIITLTLSTFITFNVLFIKALEKKIGIYGGLSNVTPFTKIFNIFIFIAGVTIIVLTGFYPWKILDTASSSFNDYFNLTLDIGTVTI